MSVRCNYDVWWKCEHGHEVKKKISNKTSGKGKCSTCNSIGFKFPRLLEEWDYEKNVGKNPFEIPYASREVVSWKCKKGHEWTTKVSHRSTSNTGCSECLKMSQSSLQEQILYYYLKKNFPETENKYYFKDGRKKIEVDIYIPSLSFGIEYDGYYHDNKKALKKDLIKNSKLNKKIELIRIRQYGIIKMIDDSITILERSSINDNSIIEVLKQTFDIIMSNHSLDNNIKRKMEMEKFDFKKDIDEIYSLIEFIEKQNSVLLKYPDIASEWDYDINGNLRPEHLTPGSGFVVWWKCSKGHSYDMKISDRTSVKKFNCPYCAGRRVCLDNCLATKSPDIAKQWNKEKKREFNAI